MDTKSKTELIAIINKQEEYIKYLEKYRTTTRISFDGGQTYTESVIEGEEGITLKEQIEALKN